MDKVTIADFQKLDIRVGTVVKVEVPEWSHWVIKLTVDLGEEIGEKIIFSGIMKFFKPEDLEGKQFPFIVNLEPKKIGPEGDFSEGMMIMAVPEDDEPARNASASVAGGETPPVLFNLKKKVPNGAKVR